MPSPNPSHHDHDFDFIDIHHLDHLVQHPYDEHYLYDPVHHFIVNKRALNDHIHDIDGSWDNDHVLLATAHLDLGTDHVEQYLVNAALDAQQHLYDPGADSGLPDADL